MEEKERNTVRLIWIMDVIYALSYNVEDMIIKPIILTLTLIIILN